MTTVLYKDHEYTLRTGESVLDGLLRHGCQVDYSCRSGSCHSCMLRADGGALPEAATRGIAERLRDLGYFLPCKCVPAEPLRLKEPDPRDMRISALVADKQILGRDLCRILLEPAREMSVLAGQHVTVLDDEGHGRPYSVAGLPDEDYYLELNVRRVAGGTVSDWLYSRVGAGDEIAIQPPAGSMLNRHARPGQNLLLLATGTGLAPLLAILRDALRRNDYGRIWLFHGGRTMADLYADGRLRTLSEEHPRFTYFGCLSKDRAREPWLGGRVTDHFPSAVDSSLDLEVFLAGHPGMVSEARQLCLHHRIAPAGRISTDAFTHSHVRDHEPIQAGERMAPPPDPALWSALGDGTLLMAVLREFYSIVFEDERLGPYFTNTTQRRLVEKQYSFLKSMITGSRDYFGQRPRNAHHWMVISDELFDYRLDIMRRCLERHGLAETWIRRWHGFEEFFRADIVKRRPVARTVGGIAVDSDGYEDLALTEATLCDSCGAEIPRGARIRCHKRLGTVHCGTCAGLHPEPGAVAGEDA